MKKLLLATAFVAGATLGLAELAAAHGGTYNGPGDTVPPGGGGSGGGGGPATPGPSGPASPGAPSPGTPSPGSPGSPGAPAPAGAKPVTGGGGDAGPDLTLWSFWWEFNKNPYINLKAHIHSGGATTGSDDFFLGHGEQDQAKDSLRPTEAQIRQSVVPALLAALETETNNDIVTGCLIAISKIGDEKSEAGESPFEAVIKPFLADSVQEISETAAVSLGILGNDSLEDGGSVHTLVELLNDSDYARRDLVGNANEVNYRTRAFAAYGLGLIGSNTDEEEVRMHAVRELLTTLKTDQSSARDVKVACLIALGLVHLQTIEVPVPEEIADGEEAPVVRPWESRKALIDDLVAYLGDENEHFLVRAAAPVTIARLLEGLPVESYEAYKEEVGAALMEILGKRSKAQNELLQSSAIALGLLADNDEDKLDKEIRELLIDTPDNHSDKQTEYFSYIALAQASGRMGTGDYEIDDALKPVRKHLLKELQGGNVSRRTWISLGVGVLGDKLAQENLPGALGMQSELRLLLREAKNPQEVGALSIATGILGDLESSRLLRDKLGSLKDDEARGYICLGLGLLDDKAAIEDIQEVIKVSKYRPELLRQAAIALGLLGDKQLVDDLILMLQDSTSLATQASLSAALGYIGDSRSIDPLVAMLQDPDITERARGFAAAALGIVADKEQLPWNTRVSVDLNYRASTQTLNDPEGTGIINIL